MKGPLISFAFDDGNASQIRDYYPILRKCGFPATFYIVATELNCPGKLTSMDLESLLAQGNEIGSHGFTHQPLIGLAPSEVRGQLKKSHDLLSPYGVRSFAYPFGDYNEYAASEVSKLYESARGYDTRVVFNDIRLFDRYSLKAFSIEDMGLSLSSLPRRYLMANALNSDTNKWFILVLHGWPSVNAAAILNLLRPENYTRRKIASISHYARQRLSSSSSSFLERFQVICEDLASAECNVQTISEVVDHASR